jgi:antirestriction protein ArdC
MTDKQDVYSRVTNKIIADFERGNLTWLQPWQAGHKAGPVSSAYSSPIRPLIPTAFGHPFQ